MMVAVSGARRWLWSETVPYRRIREPALLALLARRRLGLLLAVTPDTAAAAPLLLGRCRDAGVDVGLWPMLHDRHGRWPSEANAGRFTDFTRALLEPLAARDLLPAELVLDLEPPLARTRAILDGDLAALLDRPAAGGAAALARLGRELREAGVATHAAVTLMTALPWARASRGWEKLLGTRLECGCDLLDVMVYTSLIEGYSRGALRRADARGLLGAVARVLGKRGPGAAAALSLGAVGGGALGDERTYREPRELAEDVAVARGAGVVELALFSLGGVLARPPLEGWLDAFASDETAPAPRLTARAAAALAALGAVGALGSLVR